ncbi:MAG: pyridoxal phosphate-dependent aminotransferase family protein [Bacteroidales bacterium]|nr:pyridoxal phosphate-dependent aminotransferase family protein [Bacteroidales bacterium]
MSINNIEVMPIDHIFKYIMGSKTKSVSTINGKEYLYFGGAGYFQLQSHPELIEAAAGALVKYGFACGTSRTITGTTNLLLELEESLAAYFGTEAAAYLPSGYLSNIAGFQALAQLDLFDIIFIDEGSHYCNIDGALLSGKTLLKFKHLDINDLKAKIEENSIKKMKPLIATDGLFPIWAELAPVDEYLKLAEIYNGAVWVDDSHSVGILGEQGRGIFEYYGLSSDRLFMGATLSKAFGAYGGFVTGNVSFIDQVHTGNVMTGSSSPPSSSVAAALKGLEIIRKHPELRKKLWGNAAYLKNKLGELGIQVENNYLPIVTFALGKKENMQELHASLMEKGIYIQHVNYVGAGANGVLRIVVSSEHTKEQMDYLVESLKGLI